MDGWLRGGGETDQHEDEKLYAPIGLSRKITKLGAVPEEEELSGLTGVVVAKVKASRCSGEEHASLGQRSNALCVASKGWLVGD
jgi:hypothetical protein